MKLNLGWKLFLSYVSVLLVSILVLAAVAQYSLPGAYGRHMGRMNSMMGNPALPVSGFGQNPNIIPGQELFNNFRNSFFDALGWAALAALTVALLASLLISRRITAPLRNIMTASKDIAEGHYQKRVPVQGSDELAQLASSFNIMTEKLEQIETMRRRLIGDVAHELRTPLTSIKGSMEGLQDGILPATPETFEQVAQEANRLNRLVDDLQELSRVEAGSFAFNLQSISLSDSFSIVKKRMAQVFSNKGIRLDVPAIQGNLKVRADSDRLLQILTNLLDNACRYTPPEGHVKIGVEIQGKTTLISVTDDGIGIPKENLPYIFDRFYRVDKSRSRQGGGGSGIGLTICRYLVEAHGGRIWAESEGPGKGSRISFTLPGTEISISD